jgi:hypothetical protein
MQELAFIAIGDSRYEDRFWEILQGTGIEPQEFESLDYFSLLPFFVLAGASIETKVHAHGDHFHFEGVSVKVDDALVDPFYDVLPQLLAQLDPDYDDHDHAHDHDHHDHEH